LPSGFPGQMCRPACSCSGQPNRPARTQPRLAPGRTTQRRPKVEPLSAECYLVQFTASAELYAKLERATELLSHSVPSGDLPELFERALDALIERELKRRMGAGKPRKLREQKPGSRHVPVHVERAVRERDGHQCTFTDAEGRRCPERRFLTLEHRVPFARGGPPTVENLCLLCQSHNDYTARQAFGAAFIAEKQMQRARGTPIPPTPTCRTSTARCCSLCASWAFASDRCGLCSPLCGASGDQRKPSR
jgi:hypothetical protein